MNSIGTECRFAQTTHLPKCNGNQHCTIPDLAIAFNSGVSELRYVVAWNETIAFLVARWIFSVFTRLQATTSCSRLMRSSFRSWGRAAIYNSRCAVASLRLSTASYNL
ncbi:hypothetical protein FB451DRAFT_1562057 [Mycena latifolia]|nr:hypothetical protein FB451DRAFT_1562057 [Mycena latifolia]